MSDTESFVAVLDPSLIILDINSVGKSLIGQDDLIGRSIEEILPADVAAERREIVNRVMASGRTLALINMLRGRWMRCTFRPITNEHGLIVAVLAVSRVLSQTDNGYDDDIETFLARARDLGPLSKLSPRELEILGLIGRGMSIPEIARHLERSVKTIEWHRNALGDKLGVSNRVELARIAADSGLDHAAPGLSLPTLS